MTGFYFVSFILRANLLVLEQLNITRSIYNNERFLSRFKMQYYCTGFATY